MHKTRLNRVANELGIMDWGGSETTRVGNGIGGETTKGKIQRRKDQWGNVLLPMESVERMLFSLFMVDQTFSCILNLPGTPLR